MKLYRKFLLVFLIINIAAFVVHFFISQKLVDNLGTHVLDVKSSYFINYIASLFVCVGMLMLQKKYKDQLGFIFLALSFLKMIVLYFLLSPLDASGEVQNVDTITLFIPFVINLILEQFFMIKLLNISGLANVTKNK